mgnify:CR=1 FL=1
MKKTKSEIVKEFEEIIYSFNRRTDLKTGKNKILLGVDSRLQKKLVKFLEKAIDKR